MYVTRLILINKMFTFRYFSVFFKFRVIKFFNLEFLKRNLNMYMVNICVMIRYIIEELKITKTTILGVLVIDAWKIPCQLRLTSRKTLWNKGPEGREGSWLWRHKGRLASRQTPPLGQAMNTSVTLVERVYQHCLTM